MGFRALHVEFDFSAQEVDGGKRKRSVCHRSPVATCISTMTDESRRRPKGGDKVIPALNMAINGLNIAKEATSTTPVNPVFGSVAALLTMIRVSSVLFCDEIYQAHIYSGHDCQRTGLRRSRIILRRYLQSPRTGNEWKVIERRQQIGVRRDKPINDVS